MWGTGNIAVSKPKSILSGAHLLTVETDKGKQATMPGGEECSEEQPGQSPGPRRWECYPRWWWGKPSHECQWHWPVTWMKVGKGTMPHSTGRAFPGKQTAILSTEEGTLPTSFSDWVLWACSWGSEVSWWDFFFHFCFHLDNMHLKYSKCIMDRLHGA